MKVAEKRLEVTFEVTLTRPEVDELLEEYFKMQGNYPFPRTRELIEHFIEDPDN